jgi:hypothetical protein
LLNDKVIFDGSDFNRCLTPAAQIIYNLRNSKAALVNCDELKITSAQDRVMCLQIKKIEYEKGNDIDETTSSQVLYFFKKLRQFISSGSQINNCQDSSNSIKSTLEKS